MNVEEEEEEGLAAAVCITVTYVRGACAPSRGGINRRATPRQKIFCSYAPR